MSKEELAKNLGTIARSGTGEFLKQAEATGGADGNLIGQFGTSHDHHSIRYCLVCQLTMQVWVSTLGESTRNGSSRQIRDRANLAVSSYPTLSESHHFPLLRLPTRTLCSTLSCRHHRATNSKFSRILGGIHWDEVPRSFCRLKKRRRNGSVFSSSRI